MKLVIAYLAGLATAAAVVVGVCVRAGEGAGAVSVALIVGGSWISGFVFGVWYGISRMNAAWQRGQGQ